MVSTQIFQKIYSKIVHYLQRESSFPVLNETVEISLPFATFSTFQSLSCWKQLQMVSAISFDWFPDFWKTFNHCSLVILNGLFWQIKTSVLSLKLEVQTSFSSNRFLVSKLPFYKIFTQNLSLQHDKMYYVYCKATHQRFIWLKSHTSTHYGPIFLNLVSNPSGWICGAAPYMNTMK